MRLYCLPHAGGSARRLARTIGSRIAGVTTVPLELPGRGTRWREPGYARWDDAIDDLTRRLTADLDGGAYGLLGHSLGALLAYEVALRMGDTAPELLVVSGRNPPHLPPRAELRRAATLSDEELFGVLVTLGGVSPKAAGELTYRTFLSTLRDDLRLASTYRPLGGRAPLRSPLLVVYGKDDQLTSAALMHEWRGYTSARCVVYPCRGGHFFLLSEPDEVARVILVTLTSPIDLPGLNMSYLNGESTGDRERITHA